VKILLDENLDEALPEFMPGHDLVHVVAMGWQGMKNGELLTKAQEAGIQVLITADKNMPYQQSMQGRPLSLIVLDIHPNVLVNQAACVSLIESQLADSQPGHVYMIEGPHSKRRTP